MKNIFTILLTIVLSISTLYAKAVPMKEKIGQKIMVGFHGTSPNDPEVKQVISLAQKGLIGGVILFAYNIQSKDQVTTLIKALKANSKYPLIVSVDQEGGKVQRLRAKNGFTDYASPNEVAKTMSPEQAKEYYAKMAAELKSVGFNCNFGPVLDLHCHAETKKTNPVIGALNRAFDHDTAVVTAFSEAFISAHNEHGVLTSLKHYPGHGLAPSDSHKGLVDITSTHDSTERTPFKNVINNGYNGMVMVAHLMHRDVDANNPTSLSKVFIKDWLRKEDNFKGVVITDDLHMGAIQSEYGFNDTIINAVDAGVDILMFSNNIAANQGDKKFTPDANLALKINNVITNAIKSGKLSESQINDSYNRIMKMKEQIV